MTHLTLKNLASQVGVSPYHFHRLFKNVKGLTPTSYINDFRLNKSVELLVKTDWTITKIAQEVGYHATSYFSSCFQKKWLLSPSSYRNLYKINGEEHR
jgi:AraC family transcriptional regulator of adaptative response / methylphosphotriester-DNA alkyltransferase methyltransferase